MIGNDFSKITGPFENLPQRTVTETFSATAAKFKDKVAFRYTVAKPGKTTSEKFADQFDQISYTWKEYDQKSSQFAKSLIAMGVKSNKAVSIQGSNSPAWLFSNMGAIKAGAVSAGIYPTNLADATKHCVLNSDAEVAVVENEAQLKKYEGLQGSAVKCYVVWNSVKNSPGTRLNLSAPVFTFEEFLKKGEGISDEDLKTRMTQQKPDQVCSIIYTSGTTGMPKGAELTHDNLTWTALVAGHKFKLNDKHHGISYLPLSHIAAQQVDCMVAATFGYSMDIAPSDALKGGNLKNHIVNTRPTFFLAVPQVWEKMKEGISEKLKTAGTCKKLLFRVITHLSRSCLKDLEYLSSKTYSGRFAKLWRCIDRIKIFMDKFGLCLCNALMCKKVKAAIGLDRCILAASGAAPISNEVIDFFAGLNIRIVNLYGMSETSGLITISNDYDIPTSSCGRALKGSSVKLSAPNEEGIQEILVKGRHIFKGYRADKKATDEVFDANGYFKTGDTGKFDSSENLYITGRSKELIKTSGGENIPPVLIENKIKETIPIISEAVLIGDKQKYLTCLVTLKTKLVDNNPSEELAPAVVEELSKVGSKAKTLKEASEDPLVQKYIMDGIKVANKKAISAAQMVQKATILPLDFSVANGLMTPTLKLKRNAIHKKFSSEILKLYA